MKCKNLLKGCDSVLEGSASVLEGSASGLEGSASGLDGYDSPLDGSDSAPENYNGSYALILQAEIEETSIDEHLAEFRLVKPTIRAEGGGSIQAPDRFFVLNSPPRKP